MLSISCINILFISYFYSLLITILVFLIMFFISFILNQIIGIYFFNIFFEIIDSFVLYPIVFVVISYILPGFEPLLLFSFDEGYMNILNIRGQQWFWSYNIKENIISWEEICLQRNSSDGLFLFYSFIPCYLNLYQPILVIGDSIDVIHSWGVPMLGIKFDLIPGHITLETLLPVLSGFFVGNCFEICGIYHSFMTINLIVS